MSHTLSSETCFSKTFEGIVKKNYRRSILDRYFPSGMAVENRTEHIRHIRLAGDRNNNRMERFNEEVRDREKVMRGLERMDSPILTGYQIYHNYIKPHKGLDYKTPAEAAGIEVKGKDKSLTIIQNARRTSELGA